MAAKEGERVAQTGIGLRVGGIDGNRLIEGVEGLLEFLSRPLIPEVAPLRVGLIRLHIDLLVPARPRTLFADAREQATGHALRDRVLHREHVRDLLVELPRPERRPVFHPEHLNADTDAVAGALDTAVE